MSAIPSLDAGPVGDEQVALQPPFAEPASASPLHRRTLSAVIAPFAVSSLRRSLWQFGSTFLAFIAVDAAMYASLSLSVWLTLALAFPAAGLMVRLFIIQHDCGHGSFFRTRRANDLLGRFCSMFTFTPYAFWRRQHANHHASFNNLDRRDTGIDIYSTCATLAEYQALSAPRRLFHRISRHPILTQLLLPPVVFLLLYRVPFDASAGWTRERRSVYVTNCVIIALVAALMAVLGVWHVVLVQLPILVITSIVGVWLFSVQHRFEEAQWARQAEWSPVQAALHGSSYLKLPRVLQWFTGNIGYHHVHHLAARVPNYRLQECHEARPELGTVTTLTLWQALLAPSYALWDEEGGRMAKFPSIRRQLAARKA